ncbi:MAG TPA: hypothetical protein VGH90_13665, partial [Chthoniobacteraceae bacterium]
GKPDVEPITKEGLSADEARKTLAVFAKIWKPASQHPALRDELVQRINQISKSIAGPLDPDTAKLLRELGTLVNEPAPAPDPKHAEEAKRLTESVGKIQVVTEKVLQETRMLDAAIDQSSIEHGISPGTAVSSESLAQYLKVGTRIWRELMESDRPKDFLGHAYAPLKTGEVPQIPRETFEALKPFVAADYWGPYAPKTAMKENK